MGLFSNIKNKIITSLMGEMITDLGTLPINKYGRNMSLSIRRQAGREPYVQVKVGGGKAHYFQINCSKAWADQFERLANEIRKHTNTETPGHKDK
jgi:hypothetical protein